MTGQNMDAYLRILTMYGDKCKVLVATRDQTKIEWQNIESIPEAKVGLFRTRHGKTLVDAKTQCSIQEKDPAPRQVDPMRVRPVMEVQSILPSFEQVLSPYQLQAAILPVKIYSVDQTKKTAIVLHAGSNEKVSVPWKDVLVLNPSLLAEHMVEKLLA